MSHWIIEKKRIDGKYDTNKKSDVVVQTVKTLKQY